MSLNMNLNDIMRFVSELRKQIKDIKEDVVKNHKAEMKKLNDAKEEEFALKLQILKDENDLLECKIKQKDEEKKSELVEFHKVIDNQQECIRKLEEELSKLRKSAKNDHQFGGIMKYLTDITNGNIHNNNTIEITCSCKCCGAFENTVNFSDWNNYVHVNGSPSPRWLKFDFKNRKIQMNSYLINTGYYGSGVSNKSPKSWKVEISNDDKHWETVDERNDVSEIKENNKIKLFEVSLTSPFRFMRIITDKDNHYNSDGFVIGNLEIYGTIIES